MINLKVMNAGLNGVLTPSEFMVLYVMNNGIDDNNEWKKFYLEMLSDLTGISTRQLKRIIISLEEKGFIEKRTVQVNTTKKSTTYRLNEDMINRLSEDLQDKINNQTDTLTDKTDTKLEENMSQMSHYKEYKRNKNNINNNINNINNNIKEKETDVTSDDDKTFEDYLFNDEQGSNNVAESEKENEMITSTSVDDINNTKDITSTEELVNNDATTCDDVVFDNLFNSSKSLSDDCSIFNEDCPKPNTPQNCATPPSSLKTEINAAGSDETNVVEELPTDTIKSEQDASKVANTAFNIHDWSVNMNNAEFITSTEDNFDNFKISLSDIDSLMAEIVEKGTPQQVKRAVENLQAWFARYNWNSDYRFILAAAELKNKYKKAA